MKVEEIKKEIATLERTKFGISIPALRKLGKRIAKEDHRFFLDNNPKDTFELRLLQGFVIGYAKDDITTLLKYFEEFIPYVSDWAECDLFCQSFKITAKYPDVVYDMLMKYRHSEKEFESRIVSVMLLCHYLNDEYIDRVIDVLDSLDTSEYYSMMGVAWAIATVMAKYPEKCMNYLKGENNLDNRTYNKALQKSRESYRVPDSIKEETKKMKRS
ncbi:MAG: DNA alkylation repair protein [Clostridia bacterium]|nr:DNA alkylation repair protein [Clostridia bacterium]